MAGENFIKGEKYEDAGKSYSNAGDCLYEKDDFNRAERCYEISKHNFERFDPDYDASELNEKIEECEERSAKESLMTTLLIIGIVLAVIKFSAKTSIGCAFSKIKNKEILIVASIYFIIALIVSVIIGIISASVVIDRLMNALFDFGVMFGMFQLIIALLLIGFGLRTISKWNKGKDITRKTFLMMAAPCPICTSTIFITCSLLVIEGMHFINAGLLVGAIFFVSISGMTFALRKIKTKRTPSSLGVVMVFFGLIYFLTILIVPSYLKASRMNISGSEFPLIDTILVSFLGLILISTGFIFKKIEIKNKIERL